jgi:hypothetical protein
MTEDFHTGEVVASWRDDQGAFERRVFVSRPDNLIVFSLNGPSKGGLSCVLEFPPPAPPDRKITDPGWRADVTSDMIVTDLRLSTDQVTYHNTYSMGKGGYDAAVRITTLGGETKVVDDTFEVKGAREVLS